VLTHFPSVSVSVSFQLPVDDVTNPSIAKAFTDMFRKVPTSKFDVFKGLTGHIPAGKMTLVLAPPGGGKSAFLKVRQRQRAQACIRNLQACIRITHTCIL
jgi:ABC-type phosphate transport system ATPase subunit